MLRRLADLFPKRPANARPILLTTTYELCGGLAAVAFEVSISLFYNGTYLATLVPKFTDGLKYAVMAGAAAGGGLTVIANAPHPAGQSILSCYFKDGVAPLKLLVAALIPTAIMLWIFLCLGPAGR